MEDSTLLTARATLDDIKELHTHRPKANSDAGLLNPSGPGGIVSVKVDPFARISLLSSLDSDTTSHLTEEVLQLSHERNKRWFLQYVLQDKAARKAFMRHLREMKCAETLMFWLEVERYKKMADIEERVKVAEDIWNLYLLPGSLYEVNLAAAIRNEIGHHITDKQTETDLFDDAQKEIFLLMMYGAFEIFVMEEQKEKDKQRQFSSSDNIARSVPSPDSLGVPECALRRKRSLSTGSILPQPPQPDTDKKRSYTIPFIKETKKKSNNNSPRKKDRCITS